MTVTIGIDVGGTFTDVIAYDAADGSWAVAKVPSTPPNFASGFMNGVNDVMAKLGTSRAPTLDRIVHGTTVGTNAILERRGARLGILTTRGMEDVLVVGRLKRSQMYDLMMDADEPLFLAPRRRIAAITERMDSTGNVLTPLHDSEVADAAKFLVEQEGVEALVVCFLHSYANGDHERRARDIIQASVGEFPVSISSEVDARFREYERLVVTSFDAYIRPVVGDYLRDLNDVIRSRGLEVTLQVMQSGGGIAGIRSVLDRPVSTVLSGPAAGVVGASKVAKSAGIQNCITLDIGGTSADVSLIRQLQPLITSHAQIGGYPLRLPMVDVRTIGAGGGSIAWIDSGGALKVGPKSAGARPGPACYGAGGAEPTVTDASLVLGYLDPSSFAGDIRLSPELAHDVIKHQIADPLGLTVLEAAIGIHRIVNSRMAQTLRLIWSQRGEDPRQLAMIAFGGAGPVHAGRLAQEVGIPTIVVPPTPGVCSALGLLFADIEHEFTHTFRMLAESADIGTLKGALDSLDRLGAERLRLDGVTNGHREVRHYAEMRYVGQSHELEVPLRNNPLDLGSLTAAVQDFRDTHRTVYSYANEDSPVEFVALRSVQVSRVAKIAGALGLGEANDSGHKRVRLACFDKAIGMIEVPVYTRNRLQPGCELQGPAIVEQPDTTTVVYPGDRGRVDDAGNLIIEVARLGE